MIVSEKNRSSAPAIIAPITLVAAKLIAKRIRDVRIVPRMPVISTDNILHTQLRMLIARAAVTINNTASATTAIPKVTHKNAGVSAIVAEKTRNAVIIPIIILATIARPVQLVLQPQFILSISFTSTIVYAKTKTGVIS